MGLFKIFRRKPKKEEEKIPAMAERIVFEQLESSSDSILTKLATLIINDNPLFANIEMLDIDSANKVIAFFSGVIYALDGEVVQVNEKSFMFANKGVYDDGSIKKFLKNISQ